MGTRNSHLVQARKFRILSSFFDQATHLPDITPYVKTVVILYKMMRIILCYNTGSNSLTIFSAFVFQQRLQRILSFVTDTCMSYNGTSLVQCAREEGSLHCCYQLKFAFVDAQCERAVWMKTAHLDSVQESSSLLEKKFRRNTASLKIGQVQSCCPQFQRALLLTYFVKILT